MHVVATAGHVDHGKSALVRALTGTDPDRLPEEHRRGLTIELGFCWTSLPGAGEVAFVDVPGHERFVPTMLAGVGPVPVALLVVAADDPWMPQAAEHLAALDALGVAHGVVAVTRSDLADPRTSTDRAREEAARTSLSGAPVVAVSARTGTGLEGLRQALVSVLAALPPPEPDADVRLWVDRRFTMHGVGTVVTGTLPAGRVAVGDRLTHPGGQVRVRAVHTLGRAVDAADGVARVALNITGDDEIVRGTPLTTPGAWHLTDVVDVRLLPAPGAGGSARPPGQPLLHIGAAAVSVHHRPLGDGLARLRLSRPLPLRVGDRALLRDPGSRAMWGVVLLDPAPAPLTRRGAAARRAAALATVDGTADLAGEIARREVADLALLRRIGVPTAGADAHGVVDGDLVASTDRIRHALAAADRLLRAHDAARPLDPGLPPAALAAQVGLPEGLLRAAMRPPLRLAGGRVVHSGSAGLPTELSSAIAVLEDDLVRAPFAAPTADRLRELGLDDRAIAAAARVGRLLRPAPGIVLPADAETTAVAWLADLPQPFTTSQARVRLGTSRRVALPLLEHLDRRGLTRRLADDRRELTGEAAR